jgi:hypothetical protein
MYVVYWHDITDILLKVALNTIKPNQRYNSLIVYICITFNMYLLCNFFITFCTFFNKYLFLFMFIEVVPLSVVIGTDCIGNCKSSSNKITTTTARNIPWYINFVMKKSLNLLDHFNVEFGIIKFKCSTPHTV